MKSETQLAFEQIPINQAKAEFLSSKVKQDMVETCGRFAQLIGSSRNTGQIYGLLYLNKAPFSLDNICGILGISKASTSTGTRQLLGWRAIRKVWIPGERKDYYEAIDDFRELINGSYRALIKPRISSSSSRLKHLQDSLENDRKMNNITKEQYSFISSRLNNINKIHKKIKNFLPLLEKILD